MRTLNITILLVFWMTTVSCASYESEKFVTLLKRIETLEQQHRDSHSRIKQLEHTVTFQSKFIESQVDEIKYLKDAIQKDRTLLQQTYRKTGKNQHRIKTLRTILIKSASLKIHENADPQKSKNDLYNTTSKLLNGNSVITPQHSNHLFNETKGRSVRIRQERTGIAFSTYLDHDVNLGLHQTIKFNQIITNDGNGYNPYSGIFTCPEAGVYLLSFFIGQRPDPADVKEFAAELMINNVNIVNAVVDSFHRTQDLQGGNTVIVRLKQGDVVWVSALGSGIHVEGSTGLRITTFSGAFLYA